MNKGEVKYIYIYTPNTDYLTGWCQRARKINIFLYTSPFCYQFT